MWDLMRYTREMKQLFVLANIATIKIFKKPIKYKINKQLSDTKSPHTHSQQIDESNNEENKHTCQSDCC